MASPTRPSLFWQSRLLGRSGYATMAREIVRNLSGKDIDLAFRPFSTEPEKDPGTRESAWYQQVSNAPVLPGSCYLACHTAAGQFGGSYFHEAREMNPGHSRYIGYTMFESDRIPANWVEAIEAMDEIWVPTKFNLETFSRSGVPREKIRVMPMGVDPARFDAGQRQPFPLGNSKEFKFLSIFEWSLRKGWDALLRAYCQEFRKEEGVSLVLCTYRGAGVNDAHNPVNLREQLERFLAREIGMSRAQAPEIVLLEERIPDERWGDLFASADSFVLPTRGEGWGVPYTEAAASGLPVIATAWGAQLEYLNKDNAYLIEIEGLREVPSGQIRDNWLYAGHRWAEPSVASLRQQMRRVFECREEARAKGKLARESMISGFTLSHTSERIVSRLQEIAPSRAASVPSDARADSKQADPLQLLWIGDDPEEEGLRTLLATYCVVFEAPGTATLRIAAASPESAAKIAEVVESFRSMCRSELSFEGFANGARREELLANADLFVYPAERLEVSERIQEAIRQDLCLLASRESVPQPLRRSGFGMILSTRKISKGNGANRRLVGKVYPVVLSQLLKWTVGHRAELGQMAAAAKKLQTGSARTDQARIRALAQANLEGVSGSLEPCRVLVSQERGGWSGVMNAEMRRESRELVAIVEGKIAIQERAVCAMREDAKAAMLYETSSQGAYALVRPRVVLAYAELDERFQGFEALREWARAVRSRGGVVIAGSDHRIGAPFENAQDDGAVAFLEVAQALAADGKHGESIHAARQALEWKRDYAEALAFLGKSLFERGEDSDAEEAVKILKRALELCPADARVHHILGDAFASGRDFSAALMHLETATKLDPENSTAWNDLGVVQASLGNLRNSLNSLLRSHRIDQSNVDAWENGAAVLEELGEQSQAQEWRRQAEAYRATR